MKFEYANVKYGSIIFKNKKVIAFTKCFFHFFGHPVDTLRYNVYRMEIYSKHNLNLPHDDNPYNVSK